MPRDLATEFVTDRTGIACVLGCSINHVNKLVSRGMPRRARGQYAIPDVVRWMIEDATTRGGIDPDALPDVVEARRQLYEAQTTEKRISIARQRADLIPSDEVKQAMLDLLQTLVLALEGLPVRVAPIVFGAATRAEAVGMLRTQCNEHRRELADRFATLAESLAIDGESSVPATGTNGGGLGRRGARAATGEPATGTVGD